MATTYRLRRKTFANVAGAATKTVQQLQSKGYQAAGNGLFGNFKNMWNGTQTMVNEKGTEAMAKLSAGQRVKQGAIGVAKVGGVAAGTAAVAGGIGAKKIDNAANGIG